GVAAGLLGLDVDIDGLSRRKVLVEAELPGEEAVRHVLARDREGRGLAGLQVNLGGLELEALGGDGDRGSLRPGIGFLPRGGPRGRGERDRGKEGEDQTGDVHRDSPSFLNCCIPTVPACSLRVSSTSSIRTGCEASPAA